MSLKARVERLEAEAGGRQEMAEIDLGDGTSVRISRAELRKILHEIDGADTGPGPSASRSLLIGLMLGRE